MTIHFLRMLCAVLLMSASASPAVADNVPAPIPLVSASHGEAPMCDVTPLNGDAVTHHTLRPCDPMKPDRFCQGMTPPSLSQPTGPTSSYTRAFMRRILTQRDILNLTDEQVSKMKTLSLDLDRTDIRLTATRNIAERELETLVHEPTIDMTAIESTVKTSENAEIERRLAAIKTTQTIWELLTPQQQEKIRTERCRTRPLQAP